MRRIYTIISDQTGEILHNLSEQEFAAALNATELLERASEALAYLTDHAIDLDGEPEETLAGLRLRLDEAITAARRRIRRLPPDPERMNDDRAEWAAAALRHFQCTTGVDYEDALGDLLCDLMHWSDRNNFDFEAALGRAQGNYVEETDGGEL